MSMDKRGISISACLLLAVCACQAIKDVTIDAALSSDRDRYTKLIADGEVMTFLVDLENKTEPVSVLGVPPGMKIKAALQMNSTNKWIIYGDRYGVFVKKENGQLTTKKLKYGPKRKFLRNGGPDAAVRIGQTNYVFKGCEMVIRHSWRHWGEPEDVRQYGLPCNIDAAFQTWTWTLFIRGNKIWRWKADNTVDGPHNFNNWLEMHSWRLIPYQE